MGARWFVGDLHFGHPLVAGLRGFPTTQEHDEHIVRKWCKQVKDGDEVFVLGDISGGSSAKTQAALDIIAELPGTKHLISGNHDPVASMHRNAWKWQARFREAFTSVQDYARIRVNGEDILLSHYPYGDKRYRQYALPFLGKPLIHAHTHSKERYSVSGLCVSWEAWGRMVGLGDVIEWRKENGS